MKKFKPDEPKQEESYKVEAHPVGTVEGNAEGMKKIDLFNGQNKNSKQR